MGSGGGDTLVRTGFMSSYLVKDMVRFLVDRGANVNARNESGNTALTWAV